MAAMMDQFMAPVPNPIDTRCPDAHSINPNSNPSCILGLATANPKLQKTIEQCGIDTLTAYGCQGVEMPVAKSFIDRICKGLDIATKRGAWTPELVKEHPTLAAYNDANLAQRYDIYEPETMGIAKLAAERALSDWGGDRADITHLITYSTSMLLSPSLDLRLIKCLRLQSSVKHLSVSLQGCHGGANGIRTAAEIAQANPMNRILVVFVEINSAASQPLNPENPFADLTPVLLHLLFADGAAAVVIGTHPLSWKERAVFEVHRAQTLIIPDSSDSISARLSHSGMHTTLKKNVPALVGQNIRGFVDELLRPTEVSFASVNWALHPGGKAVIDAVEKNCHLKPEQLQVSRHILRNHGNMGAATILFVIEKFRNDKLELDQKKYHDVNEVDQTIHPWTVAVAMGPGITVEGLLLKFAS